MIINETALQFDRDIRRLVALAVAVSDLLSAVPGDDPMLMHAQALASAAEEHGVKVLDSAEAVYSMLYAPIPA